MKKTKEDYDIPIRVLIKAAFGDANSFAQPGNRQRSGRKPQTDYRAYITQLYVDPSARIELDFWRACRLSP